MVKYCLSNQPKLFHCLPSAASAVGAVLLFVADKTFQYVATQSCVVSPAGASYKLGVAPLPEVVNPASAKWPLVSVILNSPPLACVITILFAASTVALTFTKLELLIALAITQASVAAPV